MPNPRLYATRDPKDIPEVELKRLETAANNRIRKAKKLASRTDLLLPEAGYRVICANLLNSWSARASARKIIADPDHKHWLGLYSHLADRAYGKAPEHITVEVPLTQQEAMNRLHAIFAPILGHTDDVITVEDTLGSLEPEETTIETTETVEIEPDI